MRIAASSGPCTFDDGICILNCICTATACDAYLKLRYLTETLKSKVLKNIEDKNKSLRHMVESMCATVRANGCHLFLYGCMYC